MATYTPEQYKKLVERFAAGLPKAMAEASLVAAQQLKSDIPGRIFQDGGTEDIKGGTRTYKSASYKKKRAKAGLSTGNVDLVFAGNLQRSPKLVQKKATVDLIIAGRQKSGKKIVKNWKIARGNEELFPNKVFEANKAEQKNAVDAFDDHIDEYINKFFD